MMLEQATRDKGASALALFEMTMNRWKSSMRAALCGAYKYTGALYLHEVLARWCGRQFMTILLFHRVTDAIPEDGLTVGTTRFRSICSMLAREFRVVGLGEIFRILREKQAIPRRTVAITFDDCYHDNLAAARVLAEFALPATFFIPTAYVGTDRVFDWDRALPRMPNLTWEDIREMARLGFEIGSHTVSHANLGAVPDEQARAELVDSRAVIEDETGQAVRWFAYPFGGQHHLRPEYVPLIREAGYDGAVSAYGGFVRPGMDDQVLPREAIPGFRSIAHLEMYLAGCLHWLYALKGKVPGTAYDPWLPPFEGSHPATKCRPLGAK
jgi:peptidoglycan/xylan/chitin deacetylase (PgdA/CDA1 family)